MFPIYAFKVILIIAFLLYIPKATYASFLGYTMESYVYIPPSPFFGPGGTYSRKIFVVEDSVEVPLFGVLNESSIDVSQQNILIDFQKPGVYFDLGYYVFEDVNDSVPDIVDVTINSATTEFRTSWGAPIIFDQSRISFDTNKIDVDLSGIGAGTSSQLYLDITFSPNTPVVSISANGNHESIIINEDEALNLSVSLTAQPNIGDLADWFLQADTPFGWYTYDVSSRAWYPGQGLTYQSALFDIENHSVLNSLLPEGQYTFYFNVDLNPDGINDNFINAATIDVTIEP